MSQTKSLSAVHTVSVIVLGFPPFVVVTLLLSQWTDMGFRMTGPLYLLVWCVV